MRQHQAASFASVSAVVHGLQNAHPKLMHASERSRVNFCAPANSENLTENLRPCLRPIRLRAEVMREKLLSPLSGDSFAKIITKLWTTTRFGTLDFETRRSPNFIPAIL